MISKIHSSYGKIKLYARPKITITEPRGGGWFRRELKFLGLFLALISFCNLVFSNNTFALYTPTLSASVDNSAVSVNGNQVINSVSQTSELPVRVTVNTNNKTGYTATLNTETDETALVNSNSVSGAKIDSIDINKSLTNFSQNTWGFLSPSNGNYQPIPSLSNSVNLFSTTAKTSGNESFDFKIGMKLTDNLESGNYTNKLMISVISNPYERRAVMTTGKDFNDKMQAFDPQRAGESSNGFRIKHFKRSTAGPTISDNAVGIESADLSDYEIKLWFNLAEETMYYYLPTETAFLNPDSAAMFAWFIKLQDINLSHFDTSEVKNMMQMFIGLYSCTSLDLSKFDTRNVTNMYQMFAHDRSLVNLNLANINTSQVTNMAGMFDDLSNVVSLDLSNFNTSNVIDMNSMFAQTHKLKILNLGHLNTSRVTTMEKMFNDMWALENLDVSSFDTSNVTTMKEMFSGVTKITTLNLNNFNTSKVTDMSNMFNSMLAIENLSLPSFDTRKVTTMRSMFATMEGLKNLNISSFDTSSVRDFRCMFGLGDVQNYGYDQIDHLEHIYASKKFVISAMETGGSGGIFHRRPSLMVGAGCTYVSGTGNPFCIGSTWVVTS